MLDLQDFKDYAETEDAPMAAELTPVTSQTLTEGQATAPSASIPFEPVEETI